MPSLIHLHDKTADETGDDVRNLEQVATIPTPSPDSTPISPGSAASPRVSSACISPGLRKGTRTDSYIRGSSLEESPVSSPNSSCVGELKSVEEYPEVDPSLAKESCSSRRNSGEDKCISDEESAVGTPEQKVPKNIKLPQSKSEF